MSRSRSRKGKLLRWNLVEGVVGDVVEESLSGGVFDARHSEFVDVAFDDAVDFQLHRLFIGGHGGGGDGGGGFVDDWAAVAGLVDVGVGIHLERSDVSNGCGIDFMGEC